MGMNKYPNVQRALDLEKIEELSADYIPDGVEFGISLMWSEGFWELYVWDQCSFAYSATWKAKTLAELDDVCKRFAEGNFVAGEFETDDDSVRYGV